MKHHGKPIFSQFIFIGMAHINKNESQTFQSLSINPQKLEKKIRKTTSNKIQRTLQNKEDEIMEIKRKSELMFLGFFP